MTLAGTKAATRELVSDEHVDGKLSLNRLVSLVTAGVLSLAFAKQAWAGTAIISWDVMIGYAIAMSFATSPTLVGKFIGLRYGNGAHKGEGT